MERSMDKTGTKTVAPDLSLPGAGL